MIKNFNILPLAEMFFQNVHIFKNYDNINVFLSNPERSISSNPVLNTHWTYSLVGSCALSHQIHSWRSCAQRKKKDKIQQTSKNTIPLCTMTSLEHGVWLKDTRYMRGYSTVEAGIQKMWRAEQDVPTQFSPAAVSHAVDLRRLSMCIYDRQLKRSFWLHCIAGSYTTAAKLLLLAMLSKMGN